MSKLTDQAAKLLETEYPDLMRKLGGFPSCNCTATDNDATLCRVCQLMRFVELRTRIVELEGENEQLKTAIRESLLCCFRRQSRSVLESALKEKPDGKPNSP